MNETKESLVQYIVGMIKISEEDYDMGDLDFSEAYQTLEERDSINSSFNETKDTILEYFDEMNVPNIVCNSCENEKLFNEAERELYCPVCDYQ